MVEHFESKSGKSRWLKHFTMTPIMDLDFVIGAESVFPIGMNSRYPSDLKRRVAAASISYVLQLKSIDYAYKRYGVDYDDKEEKTLDREINRILEEIIHDSEERLLKLTNRNVVRLGDQIADITLLRVSSSLHSAKILANRGLLFETLCLVRFILEQLAWSGVCEQLDDEEAILKLNALNCIKPFCNIYPTAGRIYGFLSDFAHWNPKYHHLFVDSQDSTWAYIKASCKYKAIALCYVLLAVDMQLALVEKIYCASVKEHIILNKSKKGQFKKNRPTRRLVQKVCTAFSKEEKLKQALLLFP